MSNFTNMKNSETLHRFGAVLLLSSPTDATQFSAHTGLLIGVYRRDRLRTITIDLGEVYFDMDFLPFSCFKGLYQLI